jgi:polysaccharide pyruvyl transferase WcaK-like protein
VANPFKRIGLLHHMGGGNLGDDGTFEAVIQNIKKRWPEVEMVGLSMNPEDTRKRHGIPAFPIRHQTWSFGHTAASTKVTVRQRTKAVARKYPRLFKLLQALNLAVIRVPARAFAEVRLLARAIPVLRSLDVLVISGGGQLIESSGGPWEFVGGPWQFPFTVFKWVLAAKLLRVECIVLNVGAGPLVRPLTKRLVRGALYLADYVSFRDAESKALVQQIGVTREMHVGCDSAYSLEIDDANAPLPHPTRRKGIVGLAPMAFGDPRLSAKHDPVAYRAFIRQLAGFASWLLKNGYCVTLFCTDIGVDPPAIEDVERHLRDEHDISTAVADGSLRRVHQWSTRELLLNMSSMDYAVVCRFHAVVFAHMLNLPVLAINHHSKVGAQMKDMGLSEYCVNMGNLDPGTLGGTFESLVANRAEIKRGMSRKLAFYRTKLASQFNELFPGEPVRSHENVICAQVP